MTAPLPARAAPLAPDARRRIADEQARFDQAMKAGLNPRVEDHIPADWPAEERRELLKDLLEIEFHYRQLAGEPLRLDDYLRRFPDQADAVRSAFPGQATDIDAAAPVPARPAPQAAKSGGGPSSLGRYRIEGELGGGTFGVVYRGRDDTLGRDVAIKVPRPDVVEALGGIDAYLQEARVLAGLDHPHIVPVHDVGHTDDGLCYVVYGFVEGSDLKACLARRRFALAEAARLAAAIAEALQHAHQKGIYHRDVKPANVLVDARGKAYLADFGLALRHEDYGRGPTFAGTLAYMSPEQARRESHRVDGRADIFSLGAVFFELLTGQRAFQGAADQVRDRVARGDVRPPRQLDSAIPAELERICLKALARLVSDRYTTAADMADDLRAWLAAAAPDTRPAGPAVAPSPAEAASVSSAAASTEPPPVRVVPKGLRSFDAGDADFFLDLLPGPRDRHGLPDSLRFWKSRLEATGAESTFAVGLLYGPSGCGKSSLVKAGLLPRLAKAVTAVYVEATGEETEARLLKGLRRQVPGLPGDLSLIDSLVALRQGRFLAARQKVLLVLDQFEQWLHARRGEENTELVQALRQCDGGRLQCVVMVRDDFWMAATRFMAQLEIHLVQGQNCAAVDLFDTLHARNVLSAFGRAYGRLPDNSGRSSKEQDAFLDRSVAGLAQDGKVISVRLALFAEMVKGKPWTPVTLKDVGGIEGVGVTFLEETFAASTAPPQHRLHQKAAQAVLKALLPEAGTEIKGHMRSQQELLSASGYAARTRDFADLLRILDGELRLITPTDPEGKDDADTSTRQAGARYYQLTHDYLVPSLREWLTRKQKETRRGRAELRLAGRAALWTSKPENRHLPAAWEWLNIRLLTRKRGWTAPQAKMMRKAGRHHLVRGSALALLMAVLAFTGLAISARVVEHNNATKAAGLVRGLLDADIAQVRGLIDELDPYRGGADAQLRQENEQAADDSRQKLNTALALLPVDSGQVEYVYRRLLRAEPHEVEVLRKELAPHREELRERLWAAAEKPPADQKGQRLRAAAALASYDADDGRWDGVRAAVAADLVGVPAVHLADWMKALSPVRDRLLPPLAALCRDPGRRESERYQAADVVAEYAADRPETLADVLMSADEQQWARLWPKVPASREGAVARFTQELERALSPDWKDTPLDPSWGQPGAALVRQVEAAGGMVVQRFALCQALPLSEFDALAGGFQKAGYRLTNFRPYTHKPDAPARELVLVAAVWTRDGREAAWAHGLTAEEAMRRDAEMRKRGLVPRDVAGYLPAGDGDGQPRYAVLWGPKEAGTEDVKMYVGVPAAQHRAAWGPLQQGNYLLLTGTQLTPDAPARYSAVWWKPGRTLETKAYNYLFNEERYQQALTPSNLQRDLRLAWDPAEPRDLGAATFGISPSVGLGGVPWAALARAHGVDGPAGVKFSAAWIDSTTHVSEEVHGLDPAAHLARCRELSQQGYRPAALTATQAGGRLVAGSVWQRPVVPEAARDALAKRQAQAAVALLHLGATERVWPLLEHRPDPRLRSFLIHRLTPLAANPVVLLAQLAVEREVSRRRALVLSLGAYPVERLEAAQREEWLGRLRQWYQDDPDAGLHGAVEWLLRRWGDAAEVARLEKGMARKEAERAAGGGAPEQWYVNGQGQTLVKVPAGPPFWMGSPGDEGGRTPINEPLHRVRIPRSFAIAAKEVTVAQFLKFRPNHPYQVKYSPRDDGPIVNVTWYDAAAYCNWLSEQEGIPKEQWCYLSNEKTGVFEAGMRLAPGALGKQGYRLPTEAEWEGACRAGAVTRRYYGDTDELLGEYAWYSDTTKSEAARAGGLLKPNDLGLFDLYGNALEWTQDPGFVYRWPGREKPKEDKLYIIDIKGIEDGTSRLLRGGSFDFPALYVRSAIRNPDRPSNDVIFTVGFRVARTYH